MHATRRVKLTVSVLFTYYYYKCDVSEEISEGINYPKGEPVQRFCQTMPIQCLSFRNFNFEMKLGDPRLASWVA